MVGEYFCLEFDRKQMKYPIAPQGLSVGSELEYDEANTTWLPTDDSIALYWNRNLESDFSS